MDKKLKIGLPIENIELLDKIVRLVGFKSRENFAEVAVRVTRRFF